MLEIVRESLADSSLEVISIKGSLDSRSSRDFDRFFQEFIQAGFHFFILDAHCLQSVSSEGLASIAHLSKNIEDLKGNFVFLGLSSEIEMLFSFLSLTERIPVFRNMQDALVFFDGKEKTNSPSSFQNIPQRKIPEVEARSAYALQGSSSSKEVREKAKEKAKEEAKEKTREEERGEEASASSVACTHCGLQLSVRKTGPYMCPGCGEQFQVNL